MPTGWAMAEELTERTRAMDVTNDEVQVFQDDAGEWRWRRVDMGNGKIVATSGEGYSKSYAITVGGELNPGVPMKIIEKDAK